jgi:hypothetical protein
LPGEGIGRRADDQLAIADSLAGIGSRIDGVLKIIPNGHNEGVPEISPVFNGTVPVKAEDRFNLPFTVG